MEVNKENHLGTRGMSAITRMFLFCSLIDWELHIEALKADYNGLVERRQDGEARSP